MWNYQLWKRPGDPASQPDLIKIDEIIGILYNLMAKFTPKQPGNCGKIGQFHFKTAHNCGGIHAKRWFGLI